MRWGVDETGGGWKAAWEAEDTLGTMGCGQGLTTFSWIWLLDTEMLREACPGERGEVEVEGALGSGYLHPYEPVCTTREWG